MFDKLILWIFLFDAKNGLISIKNRNAAYFDIMNFFYWIKKKNQCPCIRIKKTGRRRTGPENRGKSGRSKAAMGPSHGAAETAHGRTMEAAHGGTAEGTATSHKGNAHKRAAPEARPAAGKRGKNQNNENELEHFALPPSLIRGGGPAIKKDSHRGKSAVQVLPSRWNRMLSHRLTVRNHAFAFGYSLATGTV